MAIKTTPARGTVLTALFFLFLPALLEAQHSGYFIEAGNGETRFFQRLAWKEDAYVLHYEVAVEREEDGGYRRVVREFTNTSFLDVNLPPGMYRFRVIPYDYLNRPGEGSEWIHIEVHPALKPELDESEPEFAYDDNDDGMVELTVSGMNLDPGAEIFLRDADGSLINPVEVTVLDDGDAARLVLEKDELPEGEYEIFVINPGGLEASRGGITVEYPEPEPAKRFPIAMTLGALWIPQFPVYGEVFDPTLSGMGIRIGVLSANLNPLNVGVELAYCRNLFNFGTPQHTLTYEFNLVAKKQFPNEAMALCFRLGAGLTIFPDEIAQLSLLDAAAFSATAGASFQWQAVKHFFLEFGLDHTHLFTDPALGVFRPWVGAGVQF